MGALGLVVGGLMVLDFLGLAVLIKVLVEEMGRGTADTAKGPNALAGPGSTVMVSVDVLSIIGAFLETIALISARCSAVISILHIEIGQSMGRTIREMRFQGSIDSCLQSCYVL